MANKVRNKGKVLAQVGYLHIRQIKDKKSDKKNTTTIAIMQGKKIHQRGFKNTQAAMDAALKLL